MKDLEKQFLEAIQNGYGDNDAAKACKVLALEFSKKFAEFSSKFHDEDFLPNQWIDYSIEGKNAILTTEELLQKFTEIETKP